VTTIAGSSVLITGGSRGIGRELVQEALTRGAERVYAGTRGPLSRPDGRVTPLYLDVTDGDGLRRAAEEVGALDVLVNNAGIAVPDELDDRTALERHLAVNLFGTYDVIRAFLPLLLRSRGAIVNNLSLNSLAALPVLPAHSVSKAAAFSLTQSLRALLAERGVRVHAVLTGPVDTDMTRALDIPKASAGSVARALFDGVEKDEEDIFPDPLSASLADGWRGGAVKALERQLAELRTAPTSTHPPSEEEPMNVHSALVIGAVGSVGRATVDALTAAGVRVLAAGRERDATDPAQVAALLGEAEPDLVVVAAGTRPRMAAIEEQSWESFSAPWHVDVRIAFEVGRAALARPLRPGSTVVILSSGAALGGSPLSGGYAGAKRTQMFLAGYLQRAADARGLGIRFVALVPGQLLTGTAIGEAAAAAYGAETGRRTPS
jgi:NAD(P)-dependent dehydrogenase (short-subunit alcohol dehydrogenase family)